MRDHFIPDGVVITDGDRIVAFGEMKKTPIPGDCEIIDAEGLYVGPGFVDVHQQHHRSGIDHARQRRYLICDRRRKFHDGRLHHQTRSGKYG